MAYYQSKAAYKTDISEGLVKESFDKLDSHFVCFLKNNFGTTNYLQVEQLYNNFIINKSFFINYEESVIVGSINLENQSTSISNIMNKFLFILDKLPLAFWESEDTYELNSDERTISKLESDIEWKNETVGVFTDKRDNNQYKVIKIGKQIWMSDNLRFIPHVNKNGIYFYNYTGNNPDEVRSKSEYRKMGCLYDDIGVNLAINNMANWKLPSRSDFSLLFEYFRQNNQDVYGTLIENGFNDNHVGYYDPIREFVGNKNLTVFRSSTEINNLVSVLSLNENHKEAYLTTENNDIAMSVRLILS